MLDAASMRAELAEIVADLPVTCSFGGTPFTATASEIGGGRAVEVDGVVYEADGEIVADVADVPQDIAADKPITVDGQSYRVLSVMAHPDKVGVTVTLKAVTR